MTLPLRTAVLNEIHKMNVLSIDEAMMKLKETYETEGQFNRSAFVGHFMALEANGLVELETYELNSENELNLIYKITNDGIDIAQKYISKKYR
ncbi:hypothetical protein KG091_08295 [Carnobacteriaceae bacterium zg-ZUI78]|nr:hypothetical protein [Carnobacteriaceae bacterium zg-ZUI78]